MKAMILAAGRGERLRPLTDTLPKPLLAVGKHCLIEWHILRLRDAGITDIVINLSYLGDKIREHLKGGQRYGVNIVYSEEPYPALETGGGIFNALPLLGDEAFIVVNGDIWTDYPFEQLTDSSLFAHLILVNNPVQHPEGDFVLQGSQVLAEGEGLRYTYSGIAIFNPALFSDCTAGRFPLAPILREAMNHAQVSGALYQGVWHDIGTPQRLQTIREHVETN